jgi:hypothetical protein
MASGAGARKFTGVLDFDIVAQQCTADALTGLRLYHRTIRAKILVG